MGEPGVRFLSGGQTLLRGNGSIPGNRLVPSGDEAEMLVLFSPKGHVRSTAQIAVKGAIRYRTWKKIPTAKTGEWQVTILQELGEEDLELASLNYRVQ